jgi:hypothetical protein
MSECWDSLPPFPHHSFETLTIDRSHSIITGRRFDERNNPEGFPTDFACRIYSDDWRSGSGFVVRGSSGTVYVITAKHVLSYPFSNSDRFLACFAHSQYYENYSWHCPSIFDSEFVCDHKLFEIEEFCSTDLIRDDRDGITTELYSLESDICAFTFKGTCLCGSQPLPSLNFLPFIQAPPPNTPVFVLGFPGNLARSSSAMLIFKEEVSEPDFKRACSEVRENDLHVTEGEIITEGSIFCISNTSMAGMTGAAILTRMGTMWAICGILLGGPAVKWQRELCQIGEYVKKGSVELTLKSLRKMKKNGYEFYWCDEMISKVTKGNNIREHLKFAYTKTTSEFYDMLNPDDRIRLLNHNVGYNSFSFLNSLK